MSQHARVHHSTRYVTVSSSGGHPLGWINVLVTEERDGRIVDRLGLSMSRENAEILRDGLTEALEATAPPPSKADRIRRVLPGIRNTLSGHHLSDTPVRAIEAILDEEGDL